MKRIQTTLAKTGYSIKKVELGAGSELDTIPCLVLNHDIYPGVEAHLFTIADSAFWIPALTPTADVLLFRPRSLNEAKSASHIERAGYQAWEKLLTAFKRMSTLLAPYREKLDEGYIPTGVWAHYDSEWYRKIREAPEPEPRPVSEFIQHIDASIRTHIRTLNENGFSTIESCSGLPSDHLDRVPYRPYVMFSERAYVGVCAHLYTLADIAGWNPCCAPHGFDIVIRQRIGDEVEDAWNRLAIATRALSRLVGDYRELIRGPMTPFKRIRKQTEMSDSFAQDLLAEKDRN